LVGARSQCNVASSRDFPRLLSLGDPNCSIFPFSFTSAADSVLMDVPAEDRSSCNAAASCSHSPASDTSGKRNGIVTALFGTAAAAATAPAPAARSTVLGHVRSPSLPVLPSTRTSYLSSTASSEATSAAVDQQAPFPKHRRSSVHSPLLRFQKLHIAQDPLLSPLLAPDDLLRQLPAIHFMVSARLW